MKISRTQPALAPPERSLRRKMSAKTMMNIQINMNQKKNDEHRPQEIDPKS